MKVLAINGSPNEKNSTGTALFIIAAELKKEGIETEIVHVGNKNIRGCIGCHVCRDKKLGKCIFEDDLVNECIEKSKSADGIILASPVYYGGISGTMKCFMDRFSFAGADMKMKPAAAIVALRRAGGVSAFQELNNYLHLGKAILTPTQYWNAIYGTSAFEVVQDGEGVEIMENLGKNMAWLLKSLAYAKGNVEKPKYKDHVATNFIR